MGETQNNSTTFSELYSKYRLLIVTFIVGLVIGAVSATIICIKARPDIPVTKPIASVDTKSGADLHVNKISSDEKQIKINTTYDGKGESNINIPTLSVPSAWAWENYRWSAIAMYGTGNHIAIGLGYRYERITFMALPFIKIGDNPEFGAMIGVSWAFKWPQ